MDQSPRPSANARSPQAHQQSAAGSGFRARLYGAYVTSGQASPAQAGRIPRHLSALVRQHAPSDRDSVILDLGCGNGSLIAALKAAGYHRVRGIDGSAEQVALAHALGHPEVEQGDLLAELRRHVHDVDAIFLLDVLEHLTRDELTTVLDACSHALRPGGGLVIHVPNAEGLHGMRMRYGDLTHELAFTAASIRQVLRVCGFERVECYEDTPVLHGVKSAVRLMLWKLTTLTARLQLLAETGQRCHLLTQNLYAVARKPNR
jgi:SAM-dependent methyltransferase